MPAGLLAIWARNKFVRAGTAVQPWKPASRVVSGGPYRFTRNPMYIALALLQAGIALLADSAWMLLTLVPVLFIIRYMVIGREEGYMEAKFGEEYLSYKRSVRRWF